MLVSLSWKFLTTPHFLSGSDGRERTVPSVLNRQSVLFYHYRYYQTDRIAVADVALNPPEKRLVSAAPFVGPYYNSAELYTVALSPSLSPSSLFLLHPKLKRVLRKSFSLPPSLSLSLTLHSLKPRYLEIRQAGSF